MNNIKLNKLDESLRWFLISFIIVISLGVSLGLIYVNLTTHMSADQTYERIAGSQTDEYEIPEHFPKSLENLLLTTHTHVISFALIFVMMGGLFYFNSILSGGWKLFLMIEPLVAILTTFGSFWGIRYIHPAFSYLTIFSGVLMYLSFYIVAGICFVDLVLKKK
ncbi:MAG: hypothetical protein ACE5D0_02380 [Fidelibacterota bacterium]